MRENTDAFHRDVCKCWLLYNRAKFYTCVMYKYKERYEKEKQFTSSRCLIFRVCFAFYLKTHLIYETQNCTLVEKSYCTYLHGLCIIIIVFLYYLMFGCVYKMLFCHGSFCQRKKKEGKKTKILKEELLL